MDLYVAQYWEYPRNLPGEDLPASEPMVFTARADALDYIRDQYVIPRLQDIGDTDSALGGLILDALPADLQETEPQVDFEEGSIETLIDLLTGSGDYGLIEGLLDASFSILRDDLVNAGYRITLVCNEPLGLKLLKANAIRIDGLLVDNFGIHGDADSLNMNSLFLDARATDSEYQAFEWFFDREAIESARYLGNGKWCIDQAGHECVEIEPLVLNPA